MRKFIWLLMMLLLAGCGGGGGGGSTGTGTGTGLITVNLIEQGAQKSVALADPAPGRVRLVFYSEALKFKKIVDKAYGETIGAVSLPESTYNIEVVLYENGTPKRMSHYGAASAPVNTASETTVNLVVSAIAVALDHLPTANAGQNYTVAASEPALLGAKGLQPYWSLATSTSDFTTLVHLAQTPKATHTKAAPAMSQSGPLYLQGEFFIKRELLDLGESPNDWVYTTQSSLTVILDSLNMDLPSQEGFMQDNQRPVVKVFSAPATNTTAIISPITLVVTDNGGIAGYKITTVNDPNAAGTWSDTMPTSFDTGLNVTNQNSTVTLYAWAKDFAGNVSLAQDGVTNQTVVLNNSPAVLSFTVPATTQFTSTFPVTIVGRECLPDSDVLQYLVTESSTPPGAGANWSNSGTIDYQANISQLPGVRYSLNLYAWVRDNSGTISQPEIRGVEVSDLPQITSFRAETVATGKTVTITQLTAVTADGSPAAAYMLTATPTKPAADDGAWSATFPTAAATTSYLYPGTVTANSYRVIYAWVKDSAGLISLAKTATVRFIAP